MLYLMILKLKQDWKGKEQETMLFLMILKLKQDWKGKDYFGVNIF